MAKTENQSSNNNKKSPPARRSRWRKRRSNKQADGSSQVTGDSGKAGASRKRAPPRRQQSGKKNKGMHGSKKKDAGTKKKTVDQPPLLQTETVEEPSTLSWNTTAPHVPILIEEALLPHLVLHKWRENGMMRDQPLKRIKKIRNLCRQHGMEFESALSLRREIIQARPRPKGGTDNHKDVAKSAQLFEDALESYLNDNGVEYWSEDFQRKHNGKGESRPTPDILLRKQIRCRRIMKGNIVEERVLHWIDAKMFYGASTIPQNNRSCVGKLIKTAEKYVRLFGPGALCFQYGCGQELAEKLAKVGVMALDCSASVDVKQVESHQRTWCGDKDGHIMF